MQATYYERLLADQALGLAGVLDEDITRLKAAGSLFPLAEDTGLNDCRGRYVRSAVLRIKQELASSMGTEQFERFQQTPAYHEALVQKAAQQYWIYETFLHLRAHGERTLHVGPDACREMLAAPLEDFGSDFRLDVPAAMLVFESPELVEAFYAGERRSGNGRNHPEAPLCVVAVEVISRLEPLRRYLRLLSAHGDGRQDYRVEVREIALTDHLTLEDILEADDSYTWRGSEEVERLIGLPASRTAWACRKADCGFYAAKTSYYRAVLGTLHCMRTMPQRLLWFPQVMPQEQGESRLGYSELLASDFGPLLSGADRSRA
jgi:hypothetical protein